MLDPTFMDTGHIKDQCVGTDGYLEYTKKQRKPTSDRNHCVSRTTKTARTKPNDQQV